MKFVAFIMITMFFTTAFAETNHGFHYDVLESEKNDILCVYDNNGEFKEIKIFNDESGEYEAVEDAVEYKNYGRKLQSRYSYKEIINTVRSVTFVNTAARPSKTLSVNLNNEGTSPLASHLDRYRATLKITAQNNTDANFVRKAILEKSSSAVVKCESGKNIFTYRREAIRDKKGYVIQKPAITYIVLN